MGRLSGSSLPLSHCAFRVLNSDPQWDSFVLVSLSGFRRCFRLKVKNSPLEVRLGV